MEEFEEWRPVVGWEGYYSVSNQGRVRSEPRMTTRANGRSYPVKGRILRTPATDGYPQVLLCGKGPDAMRRVHTLVLEAFVGPRPENADGCHSDGNKANNRVGNLRWDTRQSNSLDTVTHGQNHNAAKTHCNRGHEYTPENTYTSPNAKGGQRRCRTCWRVRYHEMRQALKTA